MNHLESAVQSIEKELIQTAQALIRERSYSGQEENIVKMIADFMHRLEFDEVKIDSLGNVIGRIGDGPRILLFDSHIDTVEVLDENEWFSPPFSGDIINGQLYGRGAVDMKSAAAASLFAASLAKRLGWHQGKTIYVTCTVMEEDCDGENLKHFFAEQSIIPDAVMICEPSNNQITLGHKGKAQVILRTHGISAHGSAPAKGKNAIYEMAEIIERVEHLNTTLSQQPHPHGTLVLSQISSQSASLNAVPFECEIYLDRRMVWGETEESVKSEKDQLVKGKEASWQIGTLTRTSWTGLPVTYHPLHPAWKISQEHPLTKACRSAYQLTFGHPPSTYNYWDFSTNAVAPVEMKIPTIGFGPGDDKLAHMQNEHCEVEQIRDACRFYTWLIGQWH